MTLLSSSDDPPLVDRLQLAEGLGERLVIPGVDLPAGLAGGGVGVLRAAGVALVLQGVAVPLVADGDDPREHAVVAAGGQGGDPRGVGLEGQDHQVGHHADVVGVLLGVLVDRPGDLPDWHPFTREIRGHVQPRWAGRGEVEQFLLVTGLDERDPFLDLTHRFEIAVERPPIALAQLAA